MGSFLLHNSLILPSDRGLQHNFLHPYHYILVLSVTCELLVPLLVLQVVPKQELAFFRIVVALPNAWWSKPCSCKSLSYVVTFLFSEHRFSRWFYLFDHEGVWLGFFVCFVGFYLRFGPITLPKEYPTRFGGSLRTCFSGGCLYFLEIKFPQQFCYQQL